MSAPRSELASPGPAAAHDAGAFSAPVLVTGATGFIGSNLVRLLRAEGRPVRAFVRRPTPAQWLEASGVEVARGDICDPAAVADALRGCGSAIHAAAIAGWSRRKSDYEAVNVEGTRNLLGAARGARLRRIVHVSSVVTIGERAGEMATEDVGHRGTFLREYERTKYLAEERALAAARTGLPVVVVNPTAVMGPGLGATPGQIMRAYVARRLPTLPEPSNRVNLVHVQDVARGILAALDRGRVGERYILGGENLTIGEMFALCEKISGLAAPTRTLPAPAAWAVALGAELVARISGKPPPVSRDILRVARHGVRADSSKAARELGYRARGARETLEDTLRSLIDE